MKYVRWILILMVGVLIGFFISNYYLNNNFVSYLLNTDVTHHDIVSNKNFDRFDDIDSVLKGYYYDYSGIDHEAMVEHAVKAYVDGIGDPYTVYMDAETNSSFMGDLEGETNFEGIGAVVSKKDYYILVEELIKDAPAYKAGVLPLDRIVKVDGEYVNDKSLDDSVAMMKGQKGTTVVLTIERMTTGDDSDILELSVVRDSVNVPSLTTDIFAVGNKKIGYINISMIGEETDNILKKEIPTLLAAKLDGMIVDVRGNGGGLMDIGVEIASHFIPKGKLVVQSKYPGFADEVYNSKGYGEFEGMKVVVLVDGLTASAGEILALALQEQINATVLGTKTFGKGTIQTLHEFPDGASLKYTIGKWFPPSGLSIDQTGILPDIVVDFDTSGYINDDIDNQLEEAKNLFL